MSRRPSREDHRQLLGAAVPGAPKKAPRLSRGEPGASTCVLGAAPGRGATALRGCHLKVTAAVTNPPFDVWHVKMPVGSGGGVVIGEGTSWNFPSVSTGAVPMSAPTAIPLPFQQVTVVWVSWGPNQFV